MRYTLWSRHPSGELELCMAILTGGCTTFLGQLHCTFIGVKSTTFEYIVMEGANASDRFVNMRFSYGVRFTHYQVVKVLNLGLKIHGFNSLNYM